MKVGDFMKKVYVIYQVSIEDFANINDIDDITTSHLGINGTFEILKVCEDKTKALSLVDNEIKLQCENDDEWVYKKNEMEDNLSIIFYYCNEPQYAIVIKEMTIE